MDEKVYYADVKFIHLGWDDYNYPKEYIEDEEVIQANSIEDLYIKIGNWYNQLMTFHVEHNSQKVIDGDYVLRVSDIYEVVEAYSPLTLESLDSVKEIQDKIQQAIFDKRKKRENQKIKELEDRRALYEQLKKEFDGNIKN